MHYNSLHFVVLSIFIPLLLFRCSLLLFCCLVLSQTTSRLSTAHSLLQGLCNGQVKYKQSFLGEQGEEFSCVFTGFISYLWG